MEKQTYNGWTNYETWRVNLEVFDGMSPLDISGNGRPETIDLKDAMQEYAENLIYDSCNDGLARDYALAFLSSVNWWEIADAKIKEYGLEDSEELETEA